MSELGAAVAVVTAASQAVKEYRRVAVRRRGMVSPSTRAGLLLESHGRCQFPGCNWRMETNGRITGEVAFIRGATDGSPRFDPSLSAEDAYSRANLIMLCPNHHREIDSDPGRFSIAVLEAFKAGETGEVRLAPTEATTPPPPEVLSPSSAPTSRELQVGSTIVGDSAANYVVGECIGRGGTAVVHRVTDKGGYLYAAKALSDHRYTIDERMLERFAREAEHLAAIDSPRVITFVDVGRCQGRPVLITELQDRTLRDVLDADPKPDAAWTLALVCEILLALESVHAHGFVHRDVTPKNVFVGADGHAKLGDFGTVRHQDDSTLTGDNDQIGSQIYISARQYATPHDCTAVDDLFAVGQIAWEMLAGTRPIANPPALDVIRPDIEPEVAVVIEALRSYAPEGRPQSATEALAALMAATGQ